MSLDEVFGSFKPSENFEKRVEKSTVGEADVFLEKAIKAGDRGGSLSSYERAVVVRHFGADVFLQEEVPSSHYYDRPRRGVEVEIDEPPPLH